VTVVSLPEKFLSEDIQEFVIIQHPLVPKDNVMISQKWKIVTSHLGFLIQYLIALLFKLVENGY
jgi:hypothetical protein